MERGIGWRPSLSRVRSRSIPLLSEWALRPYGPSRIRNARNWLRSLLTGKKQGISPILPFSARIRRENICEFSHLPDDFPTRQNRQLIRDNREAIPPYQARTGNWARTRFSSPDGSNCVAPRRPSSLTIHPASYTCISTSSHL